MRDSEQNWVRDQIQDKINWHYTLNHKGLPFWLINCPVCKHPTMGTEGTQDGLIGVVCLTCGGLFQGGLVEVKKKK